MYSLAPVMTTILCFVSWMIVVGGLIWTDKIAKPGQKYTCPLVVLFRGGIFTMLAYYGLLFWDIVIRVLFLGVIGYANIHYFIVPLVLAAVSGTIFIMAAAFTAPTIRSLLFFGLLAGLSIYAFWFSNDLDVLYEPFLYVWAVELVVSIAWVLVRRLLKKRPFDEPVLWDWSARFKRFLNPHVIIGFWVISFLELLFFLEGYSLLAGYLEPNYWLWILGIASVVVLLMVFYRGIGRLRTRAKNQLYRVPSDENTASQE